MMNKLRCINISHTVCSETSEEVSNEICVTKYVNKKEDTPARNYEIVFETECIKQTALTCQSSAEDGYSRYGQQYCKEVEQKSCYNVPKVMQRMEQVTVSYPEPVIECT